MQNTKKQILVIDDADSTRLLLNFLLSKKYNVIEKSDGLEAMFWLNAGNIPDLILLDINMPHLNGNDFLKQVRSSGFFFDIPILVLSGETHFQESRHFISSSDILKKPFVPEILFEKINQHLNISTCKT